MPFSYTPPLTGGEKIDVQKRLLSWGEENFRSYPWRIEGLSDYQIFLAEFLLRKTKAESVIPVYQKLLNKYSSFVDLAKSKIEDLSEILKPIGLYNIRSRALIEIAEIINSQFGGCVPVDQNLIRNLPECGRYIENAFLCFYLNKHLPIVDRNISRFLNRHFHFENPIELHKADHLWEFMSTIIPENYSREFNYALLDYCSLVCTPRLCKCGSVIGGNNV